MIVNCPWAFVCVDSVVPSMRTETPAIGRSVLSRTTPLTCVCDAGPGSRPEATKTAGRMDGEMLASFAEASPHARFMIEHDYRSAVVAPLVARDRTLGAISVLRFGKRAAFTREDHDLVRALAWRAALAIDNASLFSELQALEERMEAILGSVAEAITVEDRQGHIVFANKASAELLGMADAEQLRAAVPGSILTRFLVLDEHGRKLGLEDMPGNRLLKGEQPEPLLVRNIVRATGEERWLVVRSSAVHDPDSGEVVYAVNVFENVSEIKHAQLAGDFLAEASRVLGSSLDYGLTLQRITRLAVPQIADWCAIDVLDNHGHIERVAIHHTDPGKRALAERLAHQYPQSMDEPRGVAYVIRTGESVLAPDIEPEMLAHAARDAGHLELLTQVGMKAAIVVPMQAAGKTSGAITFVTAESERRLGKGELELAEELGRRAGVAIENARLYTGRTRIARTLQQALLPESLPEIEGIDLEALYAAAGELNEVGGDFYDGFRAGTERWMLVIGDVCGKGPRAAGVTALARYTLRAAAMNGQTPRQMLGTLHRALLEQPSEADLCTVCLVSLRRINETLHTTITLAGHPPPLLIRRPGVVEQVGRIGTLLGVIDPLTIEEVETSLMPGETLLLYTDGVTDAGPGGEPLGEGGLLALCAGAAEVELPTLLKRIVSSAVERSEGSLRDDVALLAARVWPVER